jgi:hypothetical protein
MTTKTVREFSAAGPCITLGLLVKETPASYVCQPPAWKNEGPARVGKRNGIVHIEPCPSCRDHAMTQYPEGYMN